MTMHPRFLVLLLLGGLVLPGCGSSPSTPKAGETPSGDAGADVGEDEKDIPALIAGLQDANPATRRATAMQLGEKGPEAAEAAEPLKALLMDADATVQRAAARALVKILLTGATDAIPVLIEMAKDEKNPLNRREAARSLGDIGVAAREAGLEPLTALLTDTDAKTRVSAAFALTQVAGSDVAEALPILLDAIPKERNAQLKLDLAWAASEFGAAAADALPPLNELLQGNDLDLKHKRNAAYAIVRIAGLEGKEALAVLTEALKDPEAATRYYHVVVLGSFGPALAEATVPALTEVLADESVDIRRLAAMYLVSVSKEQAVPAVPVLMEALADMDAGMRLLAAKSLGDLGPPAAEAVPALSPLLKDDDVNVRRMTAVALVQIQSAGAVEALPVLIETLAGEDVEMRHLAAYSLVPFGENAKEAVPALTKMLEDENLDTRRTGAMVLLFVEGPESKGAVAVLTEALKDPDAFTRLAYAQTLGGAGKQAMGLLPPLRETLKDEDVTVRRTAAIAMTQIDPKEAAAAVPVLAEMLTDMDAPTREAAAGVLATLGPVGKDAAGGLTKLLQDEEVSVRRVAAGALLKIEGAEAKGAIQVLSEALADPDPQLREAFAWDMSNYGAAAAGVTPALTKLLKDETVAVQRAAAYSLAKIQGWDQAKEAVAVLLAALRDPDPTTRATFVHILNNFTGPAPAEVIEALKMAAKDEDETVKGEAEALLKKLDKD